jgi:hypothetical protein
MSNDLNECQRSVVQNVLGNLDKHHKVNSLAGTGKTTTLIAMVRTLLETKVCKEDEICIVTFTRNAANEIAERLQRYGLVLPWIGTFHSIALKWLQTPLSIERGVQSLPLRRLNRITNERNPWTDSIRFFFVDEYQDVNEIQQEIVRVFSKKSTIIGLGDTLQMIYGFRGSQEEYFRDFFIENSMEHRLDVNYRCTKSIINVASTFTDFPIKGHSRTAPGNKPHVCYLKSFQHELMFVTQQIQRDIQKNGVNPGDIAVLSRSNIPLYKLEEKCIQYKIPVTRSMKPNRVCLSTIHGSKGLEWRFVYIIGCNDNYFPSSKELQDAEEDRRLFYVATTRAKERLVYVYSGGKEYITRFIAMVDPEHLQSRELAFQDIKFAQGQRDVSTMEKQVRTIRDIVGNLEEKLEIDISTLFPYQIETFSEPLLIPEWVEEKEVNAEFLWFLEYSMHTEFRETLGGDESCITSYYPKEQTRQDYQRKIEKFGNSEISEGEPVIPRRILIKLEDSLVRFRSKIHDVQDLWNLSMVGFSNRVRNRSAFFKDCNATDFTPSLYQLKECILSNIWSPKDFEYHEEIVAENVIVMDTLLHRSHQSLLFFVAKDTIEYEDILTILLKARIVNSLYPMLREITVFHVSQGLMYTFEWNMTKAKECLDSML